MPLEVRRDDSGLSIGIEGHRSKMPCYQYRLGQIIAERFGWAVKIEVGDQVVWVKRADAEEWARQYGNTLEEDWDADQLEATIRRVEDGIALKAAEEASLNNPASQVLERALKRVLERYPVLESDEEPGNSDLSRVIEQIRRTGTDEKKWWALRELCFELLERADLVRGLAEAVTSEKHRQEILVMADLAQEARGNMSPERQRELMIEAVGGREAFDALETLTEVDPKLELQNRDMGDNLIMRGTTRDHREFIAIKSETVPHVFYQREGTGDWISEGSLFTAFYIRRPNLVFTEHPSIYFHLKEFCTKDSTTFLDLFNGDEIAISKPTMTKSAKKT
jgi:hypothetical protein